MEIVPQLIMNSLIAGSVYMMIALGFNLIFSTVKFFDLGYGALMAVGGYSVFYFSNILGLNIWLAIFVGVIMAGFIGFLADRLVYRQLRKRKSSSMVFLLASLGVLTAIQAIIAILFSSQFQILGQNIVSEKVFQIYGAAVTGTQIIIFVIGIIIMLVLGITLKITKLGKAIRAVSDDEEVSKIVGIDSNKIISIVFFIGSMIAGLAGILVGFDTGIQPNMGFSLLLKGVIASIIGGVGNIYGAVLGAFLLGFVENFGIWKISGEWKDAISFSLLIIFLLFRRWGVFGRK